jgi:hypothetical protein
MMHRNRFAHSAGVAALAAAGYLPWMLLTAPIIGTPTARALYLVAATAFHAASLGATSRRGLTLGLFTVAIGLTIVAATDSLAELCLALAVLLGVIRSVFLFRTRPARALAMEIGLLCGGLLFARFLAGASLISTALAIWGFFLVQSLFFLVAGVRVRSPGGSHPDPFEEACRRASVLLERSGV